jgi:hypothetical protein
MTHSYLALKDSKGIETENAQLSQLKFSKGEQILMSEGSARELEIDTLVEKGYLKKETEEEALKHYKLNL